MKMKFPIIEIREDNFFVLMKYDGEFINGKIRTRHNFLQNKTKYIIDSNGAIWHLSFQHTNYTGLKKLISVMLLNISYDYYSYSVEINNTVEKFRKIIAPYLTSEDPEVSEMALGLTESIANSDPSENLKDNIHHLNL